jgi:tetratricopeptide (TPR) repeat protein
MDPNAAAEHETDPAEAQVQSAKELLEELDAEARALGHGEGAAKIHTAMGRIFLEQLGDRKSAAICYQNAFRLAPRYRPMLEAARRLFASEGQLERALALHEREGALLADPAEKAESLRSQALLLHRLGREPEAASRIEEALGLVPDHPALLQASADAALREGDRTRTARLLIRWADATRDAPQRVQLLRRAVLLVDDAADAGGERRDSENELGREALEKLLSASGADEIGVSAALAKAQDAGDWRAALRLLRDRAAHTGSADRAAAASVAAYRLGAVAEGLAEAEIALEANPGEPSLLALRAELLELQDAPAVGEALRQRANASSEPSERGHLKLRAAALAQDPLERERLFSEALTDNPSDAAAISLHARLVAQRDPAAAAERYAALGDAASHAPAEAAAHYLESAGFYERVGNRDRAAELARRVLALSPQHTGALRLLMRTAPKTAAPMLEEAAGQLPRAVGAEMLARAAVLVADGDAQRAAALAQRAAELGRGVTAQLGLELWAALAFRANDAVQLAQALEARSDSTPTPDSAELLLEASELYRAAGDEARASALLRKARGLDPSSAAARLGLLALPSLGASDRAELLAEEARSVPPERAAALHAERAAVLEADGRSDDAVQACAQALALGGVDLAVLRRLARLQMRRGDHAAALAVLVQIAEAVPEGAARADALLRAAEVAEWRVQDAGRAAVLYTAATAAQPDLAFAWAQLARVSAATGAWNDAAAALVRLAELTRATDERNQARRRAAALYSHRVRAPEKAVPLLRTILAETPSDAEAAADLLAALEGDSSLEARRARVELRGAIASRCEDPRLAALFRTQSAEDWMALGERAHGIGEYRRVLALNPQDRVALDEVEEALRGDRESDLLAEHLAFRSPFADPDTRAALSLQQAEIFAEQGRTAEAGAAYQQALASDPQSLQAVRGARRVAEQQGDKQELLRLLTREASLTRDPGLAAEAMLRAALLAADLGDRPEAVQRLTAALENDPANSEVALKLRGMLGEDAPKTLAQIYERIGEQHRDARQSSLAWTQAAAIKLHELRDAEGAYADSGRAVSRDPESAKALEARADAAEAAGRPHDASDALQKRLQMAGDGEERAAAWKLRLGRAYAELGDTAAALPLLGPALDTLEPQVLLKLAAGARSLPQPDAVKLYTRLVDVFPVPQEPGPSRVQLAEWTDELARGYLALNQPTEALAAFRRSIQLEPRNRSALRHVADLSAQVAPEESIAAHRALVEMTPPSAESLHKLVELFQSVGRLDAAFCAAAALIGAGGATPEERALHEAAVAGPPPVDLPQLADSSLVHAAGDEGAVRELLLAAAAELARALPTETGGGRASLVKGDNPVRRVIAAIARALGIPEPQLFVARGEPSVVLPVVGEVPGLLVGGEVPKRFTPRQQRFLYTRALAHVRRGTHMLANLSPQRLAAVAAEMVRAAAPPGSDRVRSPTGDVKLGELLSRQLGSEARSRLAPLAERAAGELHGNWQQLALGIRESAERAGLLACGDPAAAIGIVAAEVQGGLEKPEVARLVRFAIGEPHLQARARAAG